MKNGNPLGFICFKKKIPVFKTIDNTVIVTLQRKNVKNKRRKEQKGTMFVKLRNLYIALWIPVHE
jgi:hypothetical protein